MKFRDVLVLAFRSIRSNKLRTGITVAIIAFGIMALIGIITAIKAMNQKLTESFSTMGANGFTIRYKERNIRFGGDNSSDLKVSKKGKKKEKKSSLGKRITKDEAEYFLREYHYPATRSVSILGNRNSIVSYETRKTSPNVTIFGGDENYLQLNGFTIAHGRNLNRMDVESGRNVAVLGYDVANRLFKGNNEGAVDEIIRINNIPYRVIGVMESRGSSFGFSRDNLVITTYNNVHRNFQSGYSFVIGIMTSDIHQVYQAMGEAEGSFRSIRKLATIEENNFVLDRSDSIAEKAMNSLGFLTISATMIGFITLIGAAISLMNIMLVSVNERTKEVGLVKAIGGKSGSVKQQFLLESVMISLLGAGFGIGLGVLFGNMASVVFKTGFVVPWNWVGIGILACTAVGLLAGIYPAWKAGRLNPIEALRYE